MKLGLHAGYWRLGITGDEQLGMAKEVDRLGFDSIWAAEAYGSDAATVLAWIAASTSMAATHEQRLRMLRDLAEIAA